MYRVSENAQNLTISNNIHLFDSPRCTNWFLQGLWKLQPHAPDWSINTCIKCSVFSIHMTVYTHMHLCTFTSTNISLHKKTNVFQIKTSSFTMFRLVLNPKTHSFQNEWKLANISHFDFIFLECQIKFCVGFRVIQVTLLQQQVMLLKWLYSFCFVLGKIDNINQYKGYILDADIYRIKSVWVWFLVWTPVKMNPREISSTNTKPHTNHTLKIHQMCSESHRHTAWLRSPLLSDAQAL